MRIKTHDDGAWPVTIENSEGKVIAAFVDPMMADFFVAMYKNVPQMAELASNLQSLLDVYHDRFQRKSDRPRRQSRDDHKVASMVPDAIRSNSGP